MPDHTTHQSHRYSAFISYSHMDAAVARRLHRRLETYRLPRHLAQGRTDAARRLKPIFRDRDELAAAPDLSAAVRDAIAEAPYLIVICSQHAQNSAWVAREIALFREMHGDHTILAALIDGCSDDNLHQMLAARTSDGQAIEPLAADFRRQGDGPRLALLKLVAVLAGIRLDQLVQRDAQRRVRQIIISGASACAGITAVAVLALIAANARLMAEREIDRGHTLAGYQEIELRKRLEKIGTLDDLDKLDQAEAEYENSGSASQSPAELALHAKSLQNKGEDSEKHGNYEEAKDEFVNAAAITQSLLEHEPQNIDRLFAYSQSAYFLGFIDWRLGLYGAAEHDFHLYERLTNQLIDLAPTNPDWIMERGYAKSNLGMLLLRHNADASHAEPYFSGALDDFKLVSKQRPDDSGLKLEVADGYGWLGDVRRLGGDCDGARAERDHEETILNGLLSSDERNNEIRWALISNSLAIARTEMCRGLLSDAVHRLQETHAQARLLAAGDKTNADLRRKVRVLELFEASAWMAMPPTLQPGFATISGAIGDCMQDTKLPHNEELAAFCFILKAKKAARTGNPADVDKWLAAAKSAAPAQGDRLSARWGLDFAEEAHSITVLSQGQERPQ